MRAVIGVYFLSPRVAVRSAWLICFLDYATRAQQVFHLSGFNYKPLKLCHGLAVGFMSFDPGGDFNNCLVPGLVNDYREDLAVAATVAVSVALLQRAGVNREAVGGLSLQVVNAFCHWCILPFNIIGSALYSHGLATV